LILAVIVQYANMDHEKDKELREYRERLKRADCHAKFKKALEAWDSDGNGSISKDKLVSSIDSIPDLAEELSALRIETSDMAPMFDLLDNKGMGEVQHNDFVTNLMQLRTYNPLQLTIATLHQVKLLRDHVDRLSCSSGEPRQDVANDGLPCENPSPNVFNMTPNRELPPWEHLKLLLDDFDLLSRSFGEPRQDVTSECLPSEHPSQIVINCKPSPELPTWEQFKLLRDGLDHLSSRFGKPFHDVSSECLPFENPSQDVLDRKPNAGLLSGEQPLLVHSLNETVAGLSDARTRLEL